MYIFLTAERERGAT